MADAAVAAIPPADDYSLVHVAPTDVAVLVIHTAQILANLKMIELSQHLKVTGKQYDPTRALKQSGPGSLGLRILSLGNLQEQSLQVVVTPAGLLSFSGDASF